jgi:shikimate kinase
MKKIYGYDFDGVISIGVTPRNQDDVIITGRCIDEQEYVLNFLKERNINCKVYFNPLTLKERGNHSIQARLYSGNHKANTISELKNQNIIIDRFFDDDEVQIAIIKENHPELEIVHIVSNLVIK